MNKKTGLLLCSVVLIFSLLFLSLPSLLSTSWGTHLACRVARSIWDVDLQIQKLSLSCFHGQRIEGLTLSNQDHTLLFFCPLITSDRSLPSIVLLSKWGTCHVSNAECRVLKPAAVSFSEIQADFISKNSSQIQFHISCNAQKGNLLAEGVINPHSLKAHVSINSLPISGLDEILSRWYPQIGGKLALALGPVLNAKADVFQENERFLCEANATSEFMTFSLLASGKDGTIKLDKPAVLEYQLPSSLQKLIPPSLADQKTQTARLEISELSCPLFPSYIDFSHLTAKGVCRASFLPFELQAHLKGLSPLELTLDIPNFSFRHPSGVVTSHGITIPIKAGNSHFSCQLQNTGSFETLFGKEVAISGSINTDKLDCQVTSATVNATLHLLHKDHAFIIHKVPSQVSWKLSPSGYRDLISLLYSEEKTPFTLLEPVTLGLTISEAKIPFDQSLPKIFAEAQMDKLSFSSALKKEKITLLDSFFKCELNASKLFNIEVTSKTEGGSLLASCSLPLNSDFKREKITANLLLSQFPTAPCDLILHALGEDSFPFQTLFGGFLHAKLSTTLDNLEGPFSLKIQSPNIRCSLESSLKAGALTLQEPIHFQGTITPEMGRLIAYHVDSLSKTPLYSEGPITLEIAKEGFYFPLFPLNLSQASIHSGRLELGRMRCPNAGNIHMALSLLKSNPSDQNKGLPLWFAPLDFTLLKGSLEIERTEILLDDSLDVAIWGNIDLVKHYVNMVLGLTREALSHAFGLHDLPENYVLTIPIEGPIDNVNINSGEATTKIALLLAWQKQILSKGFGTGTPGKIIEGLLGTIATLPDQNAKIPPPKHPFPWEQESPKRKTSQEKKPKKFKTKENGLKQLFKIIK